MKLSATERLILANQYEILAELKPDEKEMYERYQTIVERGYEGEYYHFLGSIDEDDETLTAGDIEEVYSILDMHRALHDSLQQLGQNSGIDPKSIRFGGFDLNDPIEAKYLRFAQYLFKYGGYQELGEPYNSHGKTLNRYRRMLELWNQSADKRGLTKQDIERIVAPFRP